MANIAWKQVVYNVADAYREASKTTDKVPIRELPNIIRSGSWEDVNPEVEEQEDIIAQIKTVLPFKGIYVPYGDYIWKRLTSEGGDFIDYIVAANEEAYPNNGEFEGYWYERFTEAPPYGSYVWKRYETVLYSEITITHIKGGGIDACIVKFSSNKVDFSKVDKSFFGGMKLNSTQMGEIRLEADGKCYVGTGSVNYGWTWDATTQQISFGFTGSSSDTWSIISPTSFPIESTTQYVVSDDENAYPDGGELDGYWYEIMQEGITGIDFGEVTVSSETQNVTVQHNLGVVPSFVCMVSTTAYSSGYMWANINGIALRKYSSSVYTNMANTVTDKEITFKAYSSSYGWYGHHYWFAIV